MQIDFQSKKMTIILASVMAVLIVVISAVSYFFLIAPKQSAKLIDFTNKPLTEVQQWLTDNNIKDDMYQVSYEYNDSVEKEHVISQNLKADEVITKDEILKLKVSNGYDPDLEVTIPDFTDKTEDEVKQWFTDNKFSDVSYEYVLSESIAKDKFVKLNIEGNIAKRSDLIMVSISAGKDAMGLEITMPDFKDYTRENIQAWAKTNLMSLTIKEEASDTVASGKVISQTPLAGEKSKTGEKVSVTISLGKGAKVVSQIGKTQAEAVKWATNNGLKYGIQEYYSSKNKGIVINQSVTSGTLKNGSTIVFNVSVGKVPVKDYTGYSKDEFVQHINGINSLFNQSAKLSLKAVEQDSDKAAGTILEITVNGTKVSGTLMVDPGSNITFTVSKGKSVNVGDFAGKPESELVKFLNDNGLKAGNKSQRYHDSITANAIIANDTGLKPLGSAINYTVSLGQFNVDAGLYATGKPYSSLKETIDNANNLGAGWAITKTDVETSDLEAGLIKVCSVNGKTISCEVSSGIVKYVTVPNYHKQPSPCGENKTCSVGGLNINVEYEKDYNNDVPAGHVVSNTHANEKVLEGTSINVILSRGPKPKVPCPVGSTGDAQPNCKCDDPKYDYDANSNQCIKAREVIPDSTTFNLISGGEGSPQEKATKAENVLRNLGFTNVKTEYQNSGEHNGVITGLNVDFKATVGINDPIIIYMAITK